MSLSNIDVNVTVPDIESWFTKLNAYATTSISSATASANTLSLPVTYAYEPLVINLSPTPSDIVLSTASEPTAPSISLPDRQLPSGMEINVPNLVLSPLEGFNVVSPTIVEHQAPEPLSQDVPSRGFELDLNVEFPVAPDITLPAVPTIASFNLPQLEKINIPTYLLSPPDISSVSAIPSSTFNFNPSRYSSNLSSQVSSLLSGRLLGGTGLSANVESLIWNRGRDREALAAKAAEGTLLSDMAGRGFSRPSGSMFSALDSIIQDSQSKIIELSREISIKQADLEQENLKNSIAQVISLEDLLIKEYLSFSQLSLDTAKYKKDLEFNIYNASVALFSSKVDLYKAYSNSYETQVKAELSKLDIFKAEIESGRLSFEANLQNIEIFKANIDLIKSNVDIYKTEVSVLVDKLQIESNKIAIYNSEVQSYTATVQAKSLEYTAYSEAIKAELSKSEIFDSQVKAYAARVQAYSSESDVLIKAASLEESIEDLKVKKYIADADYYIKQLQADQAIYSSAVDIYKGKADIYTAQVGQNTSSANVALRNVENNLNSNKAAADIAIQNAQLKLTALSNSHTATIEGKKAAGSIHQAIGASALSAINVSSGLTGSVSLSASEDHKYTDF